MASEFEDRKRLTFEQAEGAEPLPAQLLQKEISSELRALLWEEVYHSFQGCVIEDKFAATECVEGRWHDILYKNHVYREHRPVDDFTPEDHDALRLKMRSIFFEGNYVEILGFVQFSLRVGGPPGFVEGIEWGLQRARHAYADFG